PKRSSFESWKLGLSLEVQSGFSRFLHFRLSGELGARAENPSIQYFSTLFYSPLERMIGRSSGVLCLKLERASSGDFTHPVLLQYARAGKLTLERVPLLHVRSSGVAPSSATSVARAVYKVCKSISCMIFSLDECSSQRLSKYGLCSNITFYTGAMKPTSLPKRSRDQVSSNVRKPLHIGLKGGGCPVGTVPIRRTTKEDLNREKLASKIMTPADDTSGADYAIVETIDGPNKYSGASAVLSVHQPDVVGKQYSAGRMMIQNGPDSLQVGWRVDPSLFGDARPRLFIYTNAGQSHCFNTNCPGFVIVDTEIPLGEVIGKVSIRGGTSVAMEIYILQVFSPPGTPKPAMGGGYFLIEDTRYDAFFMNIALKSPSGGDINPQTYEFTNSRKLYEVKDEGYQGAHFGHLVLYGGPGGS
ncbi:hypothetical protein HYC85_030924, partial [Camellia sinensis]